jgi:hypothetical protein
MPSRVPVFDYGGLAPVNEACEPPGPDIGQDEAKKEGGDTSRRMTQRVARTFGGERVQVDPAAPLSEQQDEEKGDR